MGIWSKLRSVQPHRWLPDYCRGRVGRETAPPAATVHVLFAIADHWEPSVAGACAATADARTRDWATLYPSAAGPHCDADGRAPQHSFFYPFDMLRPSELEALGNLCAAGFGEVEVHLHHQDDTSASLTRKLEEAV